MVRTGDLLNNRFRLVRQLRRGTRSLIFEAIHETLDFKVAIKVLRPELVSNEKEVQRFLRDARNGAAAKHPGLVEVRDIGVTDDGAPFVVMELVSGPCLAHVTRGGRQLGVSTTASIAAQLLNALSAMHELGVIHGDVRPENIILCDGGEYAAGRVKLLAPGMAELPRVGGNAGLELLPRKCMSPEQIWGVTEPDTRADLYAVGAVIYQCLGGAPPFSGSDRLTQLESLLFAEPLPLSERRLELPAKLTEVVAKAMARRRADRFQDAQEMLAAVYPFLKNASHSNPTERRERPEASAPVRTMHDHAQRNLQPTVRRLPTTWATLLDVISPHLA